MYIYIIPNVAGRMVFLCCLACPIAQAGWDTMRTYEILAAGCVPVFAGLHAAPAGGAMGLLPRGLLNLARTLPGVRFHEGAVAAGEGSVATPPTLSVDSARFDDAAFRDVACVV